MNDDRMNLYPKRTGRKHEKPAPQPRKTLRETERHKSPQAVMWRGFDENL
jgi:hypothetical protein